MGSDPRLLIKSILKPVVTDFGVLHPETHSANSNVMAISLMFNGLICSAFFLITLFILMLLILFQYRKLSIDYYFLEGSDAIQCGFKQVDSGHPLRDIKLQLTGSLPVLKYHPALHIHYSKPGKGLFLAGNMKLTACRIGKYRW